jgi:disulfide bond formation protein DsbB
MRDLVDQNTFDTFNSLLTVAGQVALLGCGILWLLRNRLRWWDELRAAIAPIALPLAFVVALVTTMGSLHLSLAADYPPCTLCWYQRIAMFPNVIIVGVAALRRDSAVRFTVWPLVGIGATISTWHYIHERFPTMIGATCELDNPCSVLWIWKFHYISIPLMALTSFALIAVLVGLAPRGSGRDAEVTERSSVADAPDDVAAETRPVTDPAPQPSEATP